MIPIGDRRPADDGSRVVETSPRVEPRRSTPTTVRRVPADHVGAPGAVGRVRPRSSEREVIRRAPLDTADILAALDTAKYVQPDLKNARGSTPAGGTVTSLGGKLDQSTGSQQNDTRHYDLANKRYDHETMRQRVDAVMAQYRDRFSSDHSTTTNNAVLLAIALQGVARVIADEIYDPSLAPTIAADLADLYRGEIRRALPKDKDGAAQYRAKSLELAGVLVSDDPVSLHMHGDLPADVAAARIAAMATSAKWAPTKMFDLLRQKFESELAAMSIQDAKARQTTGAYSIRETPGEISSDYLVRLFPDLANVPGGAKDTKPPETSTSGPLKFGADAKRKLDDLRATVGSRARAAAAGATTANGVALTTGQAAHLSAVDAEDAGNLASREAQVKAALVRGFDGCPGLSDSQATKVITELKTKIPQIPLTVTVKGYQWFGPGKSVDNFDPVFKPGSSRGNKATRGELAGKPDQLATDQRYLGKWTGASDRPDTYGTFRSWKDQRMTGNRDLSDAELPAFGALNANFAMSGGAGGVTADMNKAYKDGTGEDIPIHPGQVPEPGVAYYGDVHFVLDPAKVGDRVVYTATDHGRPHRNPFLMFADLLVGDGAGYQASITGVESAPIKNPARAALIVNAVLGGNLQYVDNLAMEIQIFGGLDLSRDATRAYVAGRIPPIVAQRIMALQDTFQIPFEIFEPPDDAVFVSTPADLLAKVTTQMQQA